MKIMLAPSLHDDRSAQIGDRLGSECLRDLYLYWKANNGPALSFRAAAIDPSRIGKCLPYVIILDVVGDPRRFRYRFVGTSVDGVNGQYRTGRFLDEIDLGDQTAKTINMMQGVVEDKAPSYYMGEFVAHDGRLLRYERIAMPLSSDGRTVDAILVGLQYLLVVEGDIDIRHDALPEYLER